MSKKTRKKSSKTPAKKPRPKTSAAKTTGSEGGPPRLESIGQKAGGQGRQGGSQKGRQDRRQETSQSGQSRFGKSVSQGPIETVKIRSIGAAQGHSKPAPRQLAAGSRAGPAELVEGAMAPAFQLPRDGGDSVSLADYAGKKLVLFFYPRADTPGCTREAIDFTRLSGAFADAGSRRARHLRRQRQGPGILPRQAPAFGSSDFG